MPESLPDWARAFQVCRRDTRTRYFDTFCFCFGRWCRLLRDRLAHDAHACAQYERLQDSLRHAIESHLHQELPSSS
jgi:hypothetical protein